MAVSKLLVSSAGCFYINKQAAILLKNKQTALLFKGR